MQCITTKRQWLPDGYFEQHNPPKKVTGIPTAVAHTRFHKNYLKLFTYCNAANGQTNKRTDAGDWRIDYVFGACNNA